MRSAMPSMIWSASACASLPRPRHADVLLVTGPVTKNMREALERTYEATPNPKWVVAVGDCAINCGVFAHSYACAGPVSAVIPVDLEI